jgi:hypothetical protein
MSFTCPTSEALYVEEIKTIVLRGDDGINIPKPVREVAYELAVDVIIRSIVKETYKNFECSPPESFFGVAVVVLQDCCDLKVPLKFPRQRVYYGRVPEAFIQWDNRINFGRDIAYHGRTTQTIGNLGAALGFSVTPEVGCCAYPESLWRELPIREVYVNVPFGTQYEIEVTWLRPEGFVDECGTTQLGKSNQVDGDKDTGLPSEGSFPSVARDPDNPYDFLPNATPDSEQGAFSNSKTSNIDEVDPNSEADLPTEGEGTYIVYNWSPLEGTPNTPPTGFPDLSGKFLFDANPANVYTVGDRCGDGSLNGILFFNNGSQVGCAQAAGYRLNSLAFPRFF